MNQTSKNKKEKMTKTQFQKKILKIILIAYLIATIVILLVNYYIKDNESIYQKIGSMAPYSTTIKNALNIKGYSLMPYADYIKAGDTESAYEMLSEEYKKAVPYEEYLKSIEGIDFNTFDMKEIKEKSEGTYVATVVYERNGEQKETDYLLYLNKINPQIITISPNKFIYSFNDSNFNMDNIELKMQKCEIYTDNIKITALIKNTSFFDTMTFTSISVGYGEDTNKSQDVDFTLASGETKEIEISYETNYFIPNNIKIKRKLDEETLRTYTFYFEESK